MYEQLLFTPIVNENPTVEGSLNALFWGGAGTSSSSVNNIALKINTEATQVGSNTSIAQGFLEGGGVGLNNKGIFYGGVDSQSEPVNIKTIINSNLTLLAGSAVASSLGDRGYHGSATLPDAGLFYGGIIPGGYTNSLRKVGVNGEDINTNASVGNPGYRLVGTGFEQLGYFYGGTTSSNGVRSNVSRFNSNPSQTHSDTSVSGNTKGISMVGLTPSIILIYGSATCRRMNANASIVNTVTGVGANRTYPQGAEVGSNALFYGGSANRICTIINEAGTVVLEQTNVASPKTNTRGCSIDY